MLIEQAILKELIGTSGLTDLVGNRAYYARAPQNVESPYIVFSKMFARRQCDHNGKSHLASARFMFSTFAQTYFEAEDIIKQIQNTLQSFNGIMGGDDGVVVNGCFYQNEVDFWVENTELFHIDCDYLIWYNE